ncbi:MAG: Fic family protein [Planctomycetes bacterium]|nr:Fic family protein [Planctomycetota bacterium]
MRWNWEKSDWPNFSYNSERLAKYELEFIKQSGMLLGAYSHVDNQEQQKIVISIISDEAQKTSEIEGENLNRESIQSSIRRNFGLDADISRVSPAENGISMMMVELYRHFKNDISDELLFHWHRLLTEGSEDLKAGAYRTGSDPMQVVSGYVHKPTVHFEAPPSERVPEEMSGYINWFRAATAEKNRGEGILIKAALAHWYFISIHPFEDGNGRIGRALAEKMISIHLGEPLLLSLSSVIQKNRSAYYDILEQSNKENEITAYLIYFSELVLESLAYSQKLVSFIIKKGKLYNRVKDELNSRQSKVIARIFKEGPDGFDGGLSAKNYASIAKSPHATTTRDLQDLVAKGVLRKEGQLKSTRYFLDI